MNLQFLMWTFYNHSIPRFAKKCTMGWPSPQKWTFCWPLSALDLIFLSIDITYFILKRIRQSIQITSLWLWHELEFFSVSTVVYVKALKKCIWGSISYFSRFERSLLNNPENKTCMSRRLYKHWGQNLVA